jgi:hypothetical protein
MIAKTLAAMLVVGVVPLVLLGGVTSTRLGYVRANKLRWGVAVQQNDEELFRTAPADVCVRAGDPDRRVDRRDQRGRRAAVAPGDGAPETSGHSLVCS